MIVMREVVRGRGEGAGGGGGCRGGGGGRGGGRVPWTWDEITYNLK